MIEMRDPKKWKKMSFVQYDLIQLHDKILILTENTPQTKQYHKEVTKKFDYTTILDRPRTAIWSENRHRIGVINRNRSNIPSPRNRCAIKR